MALTKPSDVFIPEIIGALANEILLSKDSLLSSGYIQDARTVAFRDGTGSKVVFPKIETNTAAVVADPQDGNTVDAGSFTMGTDEEPVVDKIVAMDILDKTIKAMANGQLDPNAYVANFVAKKIRLNVQTALLAAGAASASKYTDPKGLGNWDGLMLAASRYWGEYAYDEPPLLVAHSKVVTDLVMSEEAKKAGLYGGAPVVQSGQLMTFAGKNILPLDSVPAVNGKYQNLILRRDALSLWNQVDVQYGEQRKAHTTLWQMDWWFSYAVHLSADVPVGCIVYEVPALLDQEGV